ncbi:MAG: hypothetical protein AAB795_00245 [Patescibacteria group bacterium]
MVIKHSIIKRKRTIKKTVKGRKNKYDRTKKVVKISRKKSAKTTIKLKKNKKNPIISPRAENTWETWQTFNPTAILIEKKIQFLYRAIGEDCLSRVGYAASDNGSDIYDRLPYPVYEHLSQQQSFPPKADQPLSNNIFSYLSGGSWGGAEDPRIVRVDEENVLYMTYTICNGDLRVVLTSIKVEDFLNKKWKWKSPVIISPPGELHKNWVIFPNKINGKYAILLSVVPEVEVAYFDNLDFDGTTFINSMRGFGPLKNNFSKNCWDKWIRGVGPVPIKTKYGWLIFYHAIDNDWSKYKVGAMLLDLENPTKILYRSKKPVLEPDQLYENNGFKGGVVYASGAVVKNGNLLVYYGSADNYICVASANLDKFLEELKKGQQPKLKSKMTRKK